MSPPPKNEQLVSISTGGADRGVNDRGRSGKKPGINYPWRFCFQETSSTRRLTTHFSNHKLIVARDVFKNNYRRFLCHTEMLIAFKPKHLQKCSFRPRSTPTQGKKKL